MDNFERFILHVIENIFLFIEFAVGPLNACPKCHIFAETYEVKHVLNITKAQEACVKYSYRYSSNNLK